MVSFFKKISLKETFELVGIFAVVISLLIVAYEVRQSNRIAQATTTYEIGRDVNEFNVMGYTDEHFAQLLIKLRRSEFQPTETEQLQIRLLANRFINLWTIQENAYRNGLLTDEQFEMTRMDVVTVMNAFPALHDPWKQVIEDQPGNREYEVLQPIIAAVYESD